MSCVHISSNVFNRFLFYYFEVKSHQLSGHIKAFKLSADTAWQEES